MKSGWKSILKNKIILLTRRNSIVTKIRVSLHNTVKLKTSNAPQKRNHKHITKTWSVICKSLGLLANSQIVILSCNNDNDLKDIKNIKLQMNTCFSVNGKW